MKKKVKLVNPSDQEGYVLDGLNFHARKRSERPESRTSWLAWCGWTSFVVSNFRKANQGPDNYKTRPGGPGQPPKSRKHVALVLILGER